jgi:hypothetical protein
MAMIRSDGRAAWGNSKPSPVKTSMSSASRRRSENARPRNEVFPVSRRNCRTASLKNRYGASGAVGVFPEAFWQWSRAWATSAHEEKRASQR